MPLHMAAPAADEVIGLDNSVMPEQQNRSAAPEASENDRALAELQAMMKGIGG